MVLSFFISAFGKEMISDMYRVYKRQMPYLLGVALGYWMISSLIEGMWHVFSGTVAWLVHSLLKMSYPDAAMTAGADGPTIIASGFGARIGSMCSGIESMMLFSALFVIIIAVDFKKIDLKRAFIVFFPVLAGVFLLNVVRIYLLFLVAISVSREIAIGMFHCIANDPINEIAWKFTNILQNFHDVSFQRRVYPFLRILFHVFVVCLSVDNAQENR